MKRIILVDMDGVLADFEGAFLNAFRKKYPLHTHIPLHKRQAFYVTQDYPAGLKKEVESIYAAPGFFRDLPEIPGAVTALREIDRSGESVFICTSPIFRYEDCVVEKYHWIAEHFGYAWTKKVIMTKDKTLVYGDLLIDDKPKHTGLVKPQWEHILYDAPYNKQIKDKKRLTWKNWKEVIF